MSSFVPQFLRSQTQADLGSTKAQVIPDSILMVIDAENDTGFVMPIKTAKELANIRFKLMPEYLKLLEDIKSENSTLNLTVLNLKEQNKEFEGIVNRNKEAQDKLSTQLDATEKALKRKNFWLKFYRLAAVTLGISTAVLVITK